MRKSRGASCLAVIVLCIGAIGGAVPASAKSHPVEKALKEVGQLLEEEAVKLQKHGTGVKLLNAAVNAEFPGAGVALELLERWVGRMHAKRKAAEAHAKQVRTQLEASKAESKDEKAVHDEAKKTLKKLVTAGPRMDVIQDEARTHAKRLRTAYDELGPRVNDAPTYAAGTVQELFSQIEQQYPAWKKDVAKINSKYGALLNTLTTACRDRDEATVCPQRGESDVYASMARIKAYADAMAAIKSEYGAEIENEIAAFVRAHPSGLLADIAAASAAHTQRARALHSKLDWFDSGLSRLQEGLDAAN